MADPFIIAGWLAEPDLNSFSRNGRTVRVEPKVMELCVRLAEGKGAVVSKAELLESVWRETSVGEDALTRAVSELRRVLDDDARNPRIIETISRRGYRVIGSLDRPGSQPPPSELTEGTRQDARRFSLRARIVLVVLGSIVFGIAAAVEWTRDDRPAAGTATASGDWLLVGDLEAVGRSEPPIRGVLRGMIEHELARDPGVTFVPEQRVVETLRRMRRDRSAVETLERGLELAERDGQIAAIVHTRLDNVDDEQVLTLQIVEASSGRTVRTLIARGSGEGRLMAASEREIRGMALGFEELSAGAKRRLPPVTTSSLAALRIFAEAIDVASSVMAFEAAPWQEASELLRKALDEDQSFVMARVWLALAMKKAEDARLASVGGLRTAPEIYRKYAQESLAQANDCSNHERLFIEGVAHSLLEQPTKAIAAFEALISTNSTFLEVSTRWMLTHLYGSQSMLDQADAQLPRLAELLPNDFDVNALAAVALVSRDGDTRSAAPYIERARQLIVPAIAERENSCWLVAWLEHLPVLERWASDDIAGAIEAQQRIAATLPRRSSAERDAVGTRNGTVWLMLGRLDDARKSYETVGHVTQREFNFAEMADYVDDRRLARVHLNRQAWSWNPAPFARAGLFERSRAIIKEPSVGGNRDALVAIAQAEEALAAGRRVEAIELFQSANDRLRRRPEPAFFNASLSMAQAWTAEGSPSQALRVLEEAVRSRPAYNLAAAWWIKAQVRLVRAYRQSARTADADVIAVRLRHLLSAADADHPFLKELDASN